MNKKFTKLVKGVKVAILSPSFAAPVKGTPFSSCYKQKIDREFPHSRFFII